MSVPVSPSRLVGFGTEKAGGSSIPPAILLFFPERDQPELTSARGPAKRRAIVVSGEYAFAGSIATCIWITSYRRSSAAVGKSTRTSRLLPRSRGLCRGGVQWRGGQPRPPHGPPTGGGGAT